MFLSTPQVNKSSDLTRNPKYITTALYCKSILNVNQFGKKVYLLLLLCHNIKNDYRRVFVSTETLFPVSKNKIHKK